MGTIGTFGSFGIARMAIYASSAALTVTGNNIANINTTGYCRQKLDLTSMATGGSDQFVSGGNLQFGSGVSLDGISQYRDPYMDIRYRNENTCTNEYETKLSGLSDLAFILDEVASGEADFGIIEAQFSEIVEQLQNLSEKAGSEEYDTLVRSACETLVQLFNSYADKLDTVAVNQLTAYVANIEETNTILSNIRNLNEQIRNAGIYGDPALTMCDERNLLIDELSSKFGIDVLYSDEQIGSLTVQNLTIKLAGTDIELVNGIYCTQLSLPETINMPNVTDEDGVPYFDTSDASNYMYLDANGNPTNDLELADAAINTNYPNPYTDDDGNIVYVELLANGDYARDEDGKVIMYLDGDDVPDDANIVELTGRWLDSDGIPVTSAFFAGPAMNTKYEYYNADDPYAMPEAGPDGYLDFDSYDDETIWTGGQYSVGLWDEDAGDWVKNEDGSYLIVTTTNDPYLSSQYDSDGNEYSLIQINNYVTDGNTYENDNRYQLELSGLQDGKGNYIKDIYNRDMDGSILLSDLTYSGSLMANMQLLTGEGEFSSKLDIAMDEDATTTRGIPYYQMSLDALAQQFASMFNDANTLTPQDIFACDDDGVFYDSNNMLLNTDGTIALGADGNPTYGVLTGYDANGNEIEMSIDNMYDEAYDDDGNALGVTNYEQYIYPEGVRNQNFLTDSDGHYLQSVTGVDGVVTYEKIQAMDASGTLLFDSEDQPIYLSSSNLIPEEYERLVGDGISTGIGIDKEVYDPDEMFKMNSDGNFVNSLGQTILNSDGNAMTIEDAYASLENFEILMDEGVLTDEYSHFEKQGSLFSTSSSTNNTEGINASNISISRDWSIGETRIVLAKGEDPGSSDNSNVLYMITMMDTDFQYKAQNVASDAWSGKNEFFKGSFQEMLTNTVSTLGQDMNTTTVLLTNSEISSLALDNARISVSGVDLNEEATNLMQYQKSYVAAAKLMTTLDEVLEVLLNM